MKNKKKNRHQKTPPPRPVLQAGERLDVLGTASIIQNEALSLFRVLRANQICEEKALSRNEELKAASKVVDEELRRERDEVKMGSDLIRFLKRCR